MKIPLSNKRNLMNEDEQTREFLSVEHLDKMVKNDLEEIETEFEIL